MNSIFKVGDSVTEKYQNHGIPAKVTRIDREHDLLTVEYFINNIKKEATLNSDRFILKT